MCLLRFRRACVREDEDTWFRTKCLYLIRESRVSALRMQCFLSGLIAFYYHTLFSLPYVMCLQAIVVGRYHEGIVNPTHAVHLCNTFNNSYRPNWARERRSKCFWGKIFRDRFWQFSEHLLRAAWVADFVTKTTCSMIVNVQVKLYSLSRHLNSCDTCFFFSYEKSTNFIVLILCCFVFIL